MTDLNARLLAAHVAGDAAALVALYAQAADQAESQTAAAFYLTHSYVFALETNHPDLNLLRARLVAQGAEPDGDDIII